MDWTGALSGISIVSGELDAPQAWAGDLPTGRLGSILHLAALVRHSRRGAEEVYRANVDGTLALIRYAATQQARVVFASTAGTVACFPTPEGSADEDAPFCEKEVARWPYYHSKVLAERKGRALAAELGVEFVVTRPPVLLGPGDHRFRSTSNLIRFLRGRLPFVVAGGMHFADIRDVAQALVRLASHPDPKPVYHFVGTVSTVAEFFAMAREVSGVSRPIRVLPYPIAQTLATLFYPFHVLPDPVLVEIASRYWRTTSRWAETDLGYRQRPWQETMTDTIGWLRQTLPLGER